MVMTESTCPVTTGLTTESISPHPSSPAELLLRQTEVSLPCLTAESRTVAGLRDRSSGERAAAVRAMSVSVV